MFLCVSAEDGGGQRVGGGGIFWTVAFVCLQVILSHCVSFGWSAELYLVVADRTFCGVTPWLCVRAECEELQSGKTDRPYTFLFSFKEWNSAGRGAVGVWGAGDSGWKGVFQLDTFHGCFGKQWWKRGRLDGPFLPLGSLRCQSKQRKRGRASLVQYRMSSVYSVLTSVKTSSLRV